MTRRARPDPPVDLPRVRAALDQLDRLVEQNPHLRTGTGPPTPDDVSALADDLERAMAPDPKLSHHLTLRIGPEVRDRIEAYRVRMVAELPPGVREPSLSDAARMLLVKGLELVEGDR